MKPIDYWERFYSNTDSYTDYDNENIPRLVRVLGLVKESKRHLDVGCGTGLFTKMMLDKFPDSEGYGIDFSPGAVGVAKKTCAGKFFVADANSLPFEDGFFDTVHSSGLIAHLDDPQSSISEVHRVLRGGGIFLMTLSDKKHAIEKLWESDNLSKFKPEMMSGFTVKYKKFDIPRLKYYLIAKKND